MGQNLESSKVNRVLNFNLKFHTSVCQLDKLPLYFRLSQNKIQEKTAPQPQGHFTFLQQEKKKKQQKSV